MTTDAKLILESICIGFALCSAESRKKMREVLPVDGWEKVTGRLFSKIEDTQAFNAEITESMQLYSDGPKFSTPMAFIAHVLKNEIEKERTINLLSEIRNRLDTFGTNELDKLAEILATIKRSQGNGQASKGTGKPTGTIPTSQAVADNQRTGQA